MKRFRIRFLHRPRPKFLPPEYEISALDLQWALEAVRIQCQYGGQAKAEFNVQELGMVLRKTPTG